MSKEGQHQPGERQDINFWLTRIAAATVILGAIAAIKHQDSIKSQINRAISRIPHAFRKADEGTAELQNSFVDVQATRNRAIAEEIFTGFIDENLGSKRFGIRPSDMIFMTDEENTIILAAEAIAPSKLPDTTAVLSCERTRNPKTGLEWEYYVIRLTPRIFKPA